MLRMLKLAILSIWFGVFGTVAAAQLLGTVFFDFDSDQLDAEAQSTLSEIADNLKSNPTYLPVIVVGHTDAVGTSAYNQALGQRRAQRVADALVDLGVSGTRIGDVNSRGKTELVVAVSTAERRNRRATVSIDDMLAACRSYRDITLNPAGFGDAFQNDLAARLTTAISSHERFVAQGTNGPAFQMASAAKHDCGIAVGLRMTEGRKLEYGQRCFCSSARLQVALNGR